MAPLLSFFRPEFVQRLVAGMAAVLVEFADLPETWQVYGLGQVVHDLNQLGFVLRS